MWIALTPERVEQLLSIANVLTIAGAVFLTVIGIAQFKLSALSDRIADARIAGLEAETALANEAAQAAKLKTAELEATAYSIRLSLENEISRHEPRYLTGLRRDALLKFVAEVPKLPVELVLLNPSDWEAQDFARSIVDVLKEAGFPATLSTQPFVGRPMVNWGIHFLTNSFDPHPHPAHANGLQTALWNIAISGPMFPDTRLQEGVVQIVVGPASPPLP